MLVPEWLFVDAVPIRTHAAGNEKINHQSPMIAKEPRRAPAAESSKDSRAAIRLVARISAIAPPAYPAANPTDDSVSAARP